MKISVFNHQTDLPIKTTSVKPIVHEVLQIENTKTDELTVYFVSTKEICELHKKFFNDPSTTDCITFPMDGLNHSEINYHILGEVFICPKTAIDYVTNISSLDSQATLFKTAKNKEDKEQNFAAIAYEETTLYLVHALLHLLGYDDIEESDQTRMRSAEKKHMENLLNKKLLLKKK